MLLAGRREGGHTATFAIDQAMLSEERAKSWPKQENADDFCLKNKIQIQEWIQASAPSLADHNLLKETALKSSSFFIETTIIRGVP
jgi:hypothetical protein